jgi:hypothetical protein
VIITATVAADHPLRARPKSMCAKCGRALSDRRYVARHGAPTPFWLHVGCVLPFVAELVEDWRIARVDAEHDA